MIKAADLAIDRWLCRFLEVDAAEEHPFADVVFASGVGRVAEAHASFGILARLFQYQIDCKEGAIPLGRS